MDFYKNIILKNVKEFQELTYDEQRRSVEVHKHKYIAMWFAALFAVSFKPYLLSLILCFINAALSFFVKGTITYVVFALTFPIMVFIGAMSGYIMYRQFFKKDSDQQIYDKLFDFFTKPTLYNYKVITRKDWKRFKKVNKNFYKELRSEATNHKCYHTCYKLLKLMRNPDVEMAWIYQESWKSKCGHAILIKGNYVYDSNQRRTYDKDRYFMLFKVRVFREFTHDECTTYTELLNSEAWQAFGIWCRQLGAKRDTDSEQG